MLRVLYRIVGEAGCGAVMGHQANADGGRPVLLHASLGKVLACGGGAGRDNEGGSDRAGEAAEVEVLRQRGLGGVEEKLQR